MPFKLVEYDLLKSSIKNSIKSLIIKHNPSSNPDLDKLNEFIKYIREERKSSALVLLTSLDLLDAFKGQQSKSYLLNAVAYYVRSKIVDTYIINTPDVGSCLSRSLSIALELTKDNKPDDDEVLEMYTCLEIFFRSHVYNQSLPEKGYLIHQPFGFENYSIENDILNLSQAIKNLRMKKIEKEYISEREKIIVAKNKKLHDQHPQPTISYLLLPVTLFRGLSLNQSRQVRSEPSSPTLSK